MKNEELKSYIQNQIVQARHRLVGYTKDINGKDLYKRSAYLVLEKYVKDFQQRGADPRIIVMPGLRGTGKTTLLAQLFLHTKGEKLYFSVDEIVKRFDAGLWQVMENYEEIIGKNIEQIDEPLFLFLDEIHYDKKWGAFLKTLYDRSRKIFVFCTGSAALLLREQVNADLARRVIFADIYPINFTEYRMIKEDIFPIRGLGGNIRDAILNSKNAEELFIKINGVKEDVQKYWLRADKYEIRRYIKFGTFPFTLQTENDALAYEYIGQMIEKIISFDLVWLAKFDSETLNKIDRILYLISDSISVSLTNLSEAVEMKKDTISQVLSALCRSGLLIRVPPYGAHYSQVRKPSKYLFASPALRYFFLSSLDSTKAFGNFQGYLFEDLAVMYFQRIFPKYGDYSLTYDVSEGGADFIINTHGKKVAVEIGAGEKGIKQVAYTMKQKKCDYGIIFHSGELTFDVKENIVKIPWEYVLLM